MTKAGEYTAITSLEAYIVAEPDEPTCYVWSRKPTHGFDAEPVEIKGASGVIDIDALGLSIPLSAIYRHILARG